MPKPRCTTKAELEAFARAQGLPPPPMRKALRLQAGDRIEDTAGRLKVHRLTIMRWEAGTSIPRRPLLEAYVALLREYMAVGAR